jgi:four helix bundle protein
MLHEKLICYRKSVQLAEELTTQSRAWSRGFGYLSDQLKRALASAVLNCAEGNARSGSAERKRFFQISRASIAEVGACLDLAQAFQLIPPTNHKNWKDQCHQISKILFRLN